MKSERLLGWVLLLACLTLGSCSLGKQKAEIPVTTSSDEARQLFLQGRNLLDAAQPDAARSYFVQAVKLDAGCAQAHLALAEIASTEEQRSAALKRAVALANSVSEGERRMIIAVAAARNDNSNAQLNQYRELMDLYPDDGRARVLFGEFYERQGDYVNAIRFYEAAIELDPELSPAYRRLGDAHRARGRYRQAEGAFAEFVALNPSEPNAHSFLAELMMKTGRFEESIEHYERAVALDSGFRPARVGIGNNLIFLDRPEEALRTFQELYESAGGDAGRISALRWRAATHLHQEDHESALTELQAAYALAQESDDVAALTDLLELMADILLEGGQADAALSRYAESLAVLEDADVPETVKHIALTNHVYHQARVATAQREFTTAKLKLTEYRKSLRETAGARNRFNEIFGLIALAEGNMEIAVRRLELSDLQDPRVTYWLALAYRDLGREEEARKNCRRAAEFNAPRIEFAFVRAKARRLLEEI